MGTVYIYVRMCVNNLSCKKLFVSCLSLQYTSETGSKDESDYIPDGIVLDITLVKGQRVVTVRSPVQVCRLMCTTLVYVLL